MLELLQLTKNKLASIFLHTLMALWIIGLIYYVYKDTCKGVIKNERCSARISVS
jgi:hypothetical protein